MSVERDIIEIIEEVIFSKLLKDSILYGNVDDIDLIEIAMMIERKYDIIIEDKDLEKFKNVNDIIVYINRKLRKDKINKIIDK